MGQLEEIDVLPEEMMLVMRLTHECILTGFFFSSQSGYIPIGLLPYITAQEPS